MTVFLLSPVDPSSMVRIQLCFYNQILDHKLFSEQDPPERTLHFELQQYLNCQRYVTAEDIICFFILPIGHTLLLARFHSCRVSLYSTAYASSGSPPILVGGTNRKCKVVEVTLSRTACWIWVGSWAKISSIVWLAAP